MNVAFQIRERGSLEKNDFTAGEMSLSHAPHKIVGGRSMI